MTNERILVDHNKYFLVKKDDLFYIREKETNKEYKLNENQLSKINANPANIIEVFNELTN